MYRRVTMFCLAILFALFSFPDSSLSRTRISGQNLRQELLFLPPLRLSQIWSKCRRHERTHAKAALDSLFIFVDDFRFALCPGCRATGSQCVFSKRDGVR